MAPLLNPMRVIFAMLLIVGVVAGCSAPIAYDAQGSAAESPALEGGSY